MIPELDAASTRRFLDISNGGSATDRFSPYMNPAVGSFVAYIDVGGVIGSVEDVTTVLSDNTKHSIAIMLEDDNLKTDVDGTVAGPDVLCDMMTYTDRVDVGVFYTGSLQTQGLLQSLRIYSYYRE